jgi:plasmid maintenance system antidote protein VapI
MKNSKSGKSYLINGKELKKKMIDAGITGRELATRIGVHHIYISMMVRGKRPISANMRNKIALVLK